MSEFQSDDGKEYDEEGNELDKHGFKVKKYPDGLELSLIHISEPTRPY